MVWVFNMIHEYDDVDRPVSVAVGPEATTERSEQFLGYLWLAKTA